MEHQRPIQDVCALLAMLFVLGSLPACSEQTDFDTQGTIQAVARYVGHTPPRRVHLKLGGVPACNAGNGVADDTLVVNPNKTIRNVVVYVASPVDSQFPPPQTKALLDQVGCVYTPHVQSVMVGQAVTVHNSDNTMHKVHTFPQKQRPTDFALPKKGMSQDIKFVRPEFVKIKCDVHPWMSAFVAVFDHPYHAVTDANGSCTIDLPPGAYEIGAWHEELGAPAKQSISVGPGETVKLVFEFE